MSRAAAGKRHWRDLSRGQRIAVVALGTVQTGLAAVAWTDLARRSADAVRGSKRWWALIIGVNFVGPLAYLRFGRVEVAPPDSSRGEG